MIILLYRQSDSNYLKEEKSCPRYERCPEKLQKIFDFLDWLDKNADIENTYQVNQWGDIMILACRSDQRVPGLGTALIAEGIRLMEEKGVSVSLQSDKTFETPFSVLFHRKFLKY